MHPEATPLTVSYYSASLADFMSGTHAEILGKLAISHRHDLKPTEREAWLTQIDVLKDQLSIFSVGHIHFEFVIPRMGKRADCVLLIGGVVFVIEFKVNAKTFDRHAIDQVHDYALDLKNFHLGSHAALVVPILVATKASATAGDIVYAPDGVAAPLFAGSSELQGVITKTLAVTKDRYLDHADWAESGYRPTPTIIEAAQALYQKHDVKEIVRSDAGAKNLMATDTTVARIIERSKALQTKSICFITGVPGAGKTLAGLSIAAERAIDHVDEHAVYLSGNGPLVDVLREALARDQAKREKIKKTDALRPVRAFVQNIHHFRDEYLRADIPPVEKVVVFDEAQRAWSKDQASKFMRTKRGRPGFNQSEPEFLISVMDRHSDWCTVVCLIGGGQEINTGEAGLLEWLNVLKHKFPHWEVHASALLDDRHYTVDAKAIQLLRTDRVTKHPDLHLSVSMRSFRAERLSSFVGALLDGTPEEALSHLDTIKARYPMWVTRDLTQARAWLRSVARGTERIGLVASSGAHRLRPEGIHIKASVDPPRWFLNDKEDVRSSYYLEEVATEFAVQGLELDWVGVCWDADLRFSGVGWATYAFRGTKWQSVRDQERRAYLANAYRVLLTRARQGMVIYVPKGDDADTTRPKAFYDGTFEFLRACGIPLDPPESPS